ncbi:MAG TPA: ScyD/ScyE family protein [Chthoniobacterales bacterium]
MRNHLTQFGKSITTLLAALLLALGLSRTAEAAGRAGTSASATVSVFATGLNNPRGLKFGPDGYLYVAEGGTGGSDSTIGCCEQAADVGPYTGSITGSRISKISPNGVVTTAVDNLPSSQTSAASGSLISGAADVAFIGNTLYVLLGGAGCSHGVSQVPPLPNSVLRVNADGTLEMIANLSAFLMANPVAHPNPDDFEPDGTWWSLIAVGGDLYSVEPNHGELDKITTSGQISRVADISASQGHIVPTALAYHGNFFVGNLNTFPVVPGSSKILRINPNGTVKVDLQGVTAVLGLVFDGRDRMYVLETTTAAGDPTPFTGKVVRVDPLGRQTEIASGLFFPTGMTLGPDGALYVSNVGFGPPPVGMGEVLKITLP